MPKKSAAQLKRLIQRAESRGETYTPPPEGTDSAEAKEETTFLEQKSKEITDTDAVIHQNIDHNTSDNDDTKKKREAMLLLQKELEEIDTNEELKAKERRSAKRKAEAIALETSGCSTVEDLRSWYETTDQQAKIQSKSPDSQLHPHKKSAPSMNENAKNDGASAEKKRSNPYIVFIGQLSYDTTADDLFQHLQKQLDKEGHKATKETLSIRLLQDPGTNKSRGMAFVEVVNHEDDPELLFALMTCHHTHLKGRRINVERSAGGGKNEARKTKIQNYRKEQTDHMDKAVQGMLEEYYKRGEIQEQNEIDDGVIQLCKRHSAAVVQAALERYVESNGRDMDNPSAYLTFLLGKLAEEGIYNDRERAKEDKGFSNGKSHSFQQRSPGKETHSKNGSRPNKKRSAHDSKDETKKRPRSMLPDSKFVKQGVNMNAASSDKSNDLLQIFPSLSRGRGRGRGYM